MDCSLLGSSIHGSLQARILEWVAIAFSRGSSWPRDWIQVSRNAGRPFTDWVRKMALQESLAWASPPPPPGPQVQRPSTSVSLSVKWRHARPPHRSLTTDWEEPVWWSGLSMRQCCSPWSRWQIKPYRACFPKSQFLLKLQHQSFQSVFRVHFLSITWCPTNKHCNFLHHNRGSVDWLWCVAGEWTQVWFWNNNFWLLVCVCLFFLYPEALRNFPNQGQNLGPCTEVKS